VDKNNSRLEGLQSLRGIAALAVLLFHVRGYMWIVGNNHTSAFEIFTGVFSLGAPLFFAISGFLMAHLIETGYRNFLLRRFARIYPTFFLAVVLSLFAKILFLGSATQPELAKSLTLLPFGVIPYPLDIEWTLVYEVFFYIVCAVFTIGNSKRLFPYFLTMWLASVIVARHAFHLESAITPTIETIPFQFFNMFFIVGALTYYANRRLSMPSILARAILGSCAALVVAWPFLERIHTFAINELYVFAGCCVGILLSAKELRGTSAPMQWLAKAGDYSYGIYLIHASVLYIAFTLALRQYGELPSIFAFIGFGFALIGGIGMGMLDVRIHTSISGWIRERSIKRIPVGRHGTTNIGVTDTNG
jgi:peptidoglycan/LPS O-acetylase OafA/YrhL